MMKLSRKADTSDPAFRRLLRLVIDQKKKFAGIVFTAVISNLIVLVGPRLIGLAIDQMNGTGQINWQPLRTLVILLLALYLLGSAGQWLLNTLTTKLASQLIRQLREKAFEKINRIPLKDLDRKSHGDTVNRLTYDLDAIMDGLLTGLSQAFTGLITLIGSLAFMLWLNPLITLLVIALMPVSFKLASTIAHRSRQKFREQSEIAGDLNSLAEERIENMNLVQAFRAQEEQISRYETINQKLYISGQKAQFYSSMTNPVTRLINHMAYISVAILASLLAIKGQLSVGQLASFLVYVTQFARPINEITSVATQLQSAIASARRVFDLTDTEPEPDEHHLPGLVVDQGAVSFDQVWFSYRPGQRLIENLNLTIKAGQMVAIVGPTGAGKTTLVNLLLRFYELDRGAIRIDGQDISQVRRDSLRAAFGMVLQDSWLFTGTVRDNIAYALPDADFTQIERAARQAYAHTFIKRLPDGYDTIIGTGHTVLSQGQQQLLTIARAFLVHPPLLLLDEATSNVDTHTEIQIQQAMRQLMQNRTSFVIAHRLSTIREADLILVMKDGQIIEKGSHNALFAAAGFYKGLLESQFAGIMDDE